MCVVESLAIRINHQMRSLYPQTMLMVSFSHMGSHHENTSGLKFVGAVDEAGLSRHDVCPCTRSDIPYANSKIPSFVGQDYFCDTGSRGHSQYGVLYAGYLQAKLFHPHLKYTDCSGLS